MAGTVTLEMTAGGRRPMRLIGDKDLVVVVGRFTFDSEYVTGGEDLTAADLDLQEIITLIPSPLFSGGSTNRGGGIPVVYDHDNSKIIAIGPSAVPGGSDLSFEVQNGTDLSAFSCRFIAIGYQ